MKNESSTRNDVLRLTIANVVNSGLRLLIPILLVRIFDKEGFGEYRYFWLIANSLMLILPLGMKRSLLYFLPKSSQEERAAFVSQTIVYLTTVCLPFAIIFAWGPGWLPNRITSLTEPGWLLGAFTILWFVSSTIRILPNADRNVAWQMWAIICLSVARAVIVIGVAFYTRDLQSVFAALVLLAGIQAILFGFYVVTRYGLRLPRPTVQGMRRQLHYAVPFGLSGALGRARLQVEQWIVVVLFLPGSLAVFSIGLSFNGILQLFRSAVGNVLLPKMSMTHASGNTTRSLELNNRGNIAICFLIYPAVAFIWVFAPSLVELLYTDTYLDAVPIIRIYSVTMILMGVELSTVLMIFEQGRFVAKVSSVILVISAILSLAGALTFGLPGVAAGSAIGTLLTRVLNFNRASKMLGVPFSHLQDWPTLARILAAAIFSGAASAYLVERTVQASSPLIILIIGAFSFLAAFIVFVFTFRIQWIILSMLGRKRWPELQTG